MKSNTELLAPVGKMENAIAAIENGADALFVGGKLFNARQYAENFTQDELEEIVPYAKLRGVKVYVTVNILIKEAEMQQLYDYLKYLEKVGVDAIIVQDLGVAALARKHFPKLRLHASTQMSAHSLEDVLFLKSIGFKRVVLARELQLKEIKHITENCDIEIETFIHGAMCYSYSGQCLMSSLIGGRSGNRGRCAQPCRMKYSLASESEELVKEAYLLSLKDICSIEFIPELIAGGIHSFKIEGRMKSPEYVASVVGTYRKYVDLAASGMPYKVLEEDLDTLKGIFNRGGFSKGYYYEKGSSKMLTPTSPKHIGLYAGKVIRFNPKNKMATLLIERALHPGDGLEIIREGKDSVGTGITKKMEAGMQMTCQFEHKVEIGSKAYLTKNHELLKQMRQTYQRSSRKQPITMEVIGKIGEPIKVILSCKGKAIDYEGAVVEKAVNAPLTKEQVCKQMTKLGSTPFSVSNFKLEWEETGYLPVSLLNSMRREAVERLEALLLQHEEDVVPEKYTAPVNEAAIKGWSVLVHHIEQLEAALKWPQIKRIYWEWQYQDEVAKKALALTAAHEKDFYLALPAILKDEAYATYGQALESWQSEKDLKGYLIRQMGAFEYLKACGKALVMDYRLNITNNEAIHFWQTQGAEAATVSVELTEEELKPLTGSIEKIVYGYLPVMTSSQCVLRNTKHCQKGRKHKQYFELKDRKDTSWHLETDCKACFMQVMSYEPLLLRKKTLTRLENQMGLRLQFTHESKKEAEALLESYLTGAPLNLEVKGTAFKTVL